MAERPKEPGGGQVRANDCRSQDKSAQVDQSLLHWVAVEGCHGTRSCPIVVHLVNVFVQIALMDESACETKQGKNIEYCSGIHFRYLLESLGMGQSFLVISFAHQFAHS